MAESLAGGVAQTNLTQDRERKAGSHPQFLFGAHPEKQIKPSTETRCRREQEKACDAAKK